MKIRIGLKSGKVFEFEGEVKNPEELMLDIFTYKTKYLSVDDGSICIESSSVEYIEEIKEKPKMSFNEQVEAKEFQKSLKEFQEYLRKIESFKYKDFI